MLMTTLYEGAFAKINLTLDVLGKRPDGYHDLKSVMQTISVRDDIEIDVDTGKPWVLHCDQEGIPADPAKKVEIAKRIIDKAVKYGVSLNQLHIDPCVMARATMPSAMEDFAYCIQQIHNYAPEVKVTGAISNISFEMPARKYVNMNCMAYAIAAGLDSAIMDPCSQDMMGTIYACEALRMQDKGGRKYNRAYRKGLFGQKK